MFRATERLLTKVQRESAAAASTLPSVTSQNPSVGGARMIQYPSGGGARMVQYSSGGGNRLESSEGATSRQELDSGIHRASRMCISSVILLLI